MFWMHHWQPEQQCWCPWSPCRELLQSQIQSSGWSQRMCFQTLLQPMFHSLMIQTLTMIMLDPTKVLPYALSFWRPKDDIIRKFSFPLRMSLLTLLTALIAIIYHIEMSYIWKYWNITRWKIQYQVAMHTDYHFFWNIKLLTETETEGKTLSQIG